MASSHRQTRKRVIAFFNVLFVLGVLALLGGISLMVFAFGWFSMGEDMNNPALWRTYPCAVHRYQLDYGNAQFSQRVRVLFQVFCFFFLFKMSHLFDKVSFDNATNKCALVRLDPWGTSDQANQEIAQFGSGSNVTTCFCPTSNANLFFPHNEWSLYKFCYFKVTDSEIAQLVYIYLLLSDVVVFLKTFF
jgi:hypothetical protein